jgi:hypothetical protein
MFLPPDANGNDEKFIAYQCSKEHKDFFEGNDRSPDLSTGPRLKSCWAQGARRNPQRTNWLGPLKEKTKLIVSELTSDAEMDSVSNRNSVARAIPIHICASKARTSEPFPRFNIRSTDSNPPQEETWYRRRPPWTP